MMSLDHRAVANLDPRVMVGRIYVGTTRRYILNTYAVSCWPRV